MWTWFSGRVNKWVVLGSISITLTLFVFCAVSLWNIPPLAIERNAPTASLLLVAVPTATATTPPVATPQVVIPTADGSGITLGKYVQITGTDGEGLNIRSAPGVNESSRFMGMDSEVFQVNGGPREADGYTWWYLVAPYDENRNGWAASKYLSVVY